MLENQEQVEFAPQYQVKLFYSEGTLLREGKWHFTRISCDSYQHLFLILIPKKFLLSISFRFSIFFY